MTKRLFLCLLAVFAVIVSAGNVHAQVEQGGITGRVFERAVPSFDQVRFTLLLQPQKCEPRGVEYDELNECRDNQVRER
jgi:hypothetical protein